MKNKILPIILIVIALIFSFAASCYAYNENDDYYCFIDTSNKTILVKANDITYDGSFDFRRYSSTGFYDIVNNLDVSIVQYDSTNRCYFLYYIEKDNLDKFLLTYDTVNKHYTVRFSSDDGVIYNVYSIKVFDISSPDYGASPIFGFLAYKDGIGVGGSISFKTDALVYSSFDMKDENGNVVFQAPPQVEQETTQVQILAPIVEGMEMEPLQEIMGILPVVVVVIVGLLAIRKAIIWIRQTLKNS